MKSQRFGMELEMTGLTRNAAAKVIAKYFGTTAIAVGGSYDAYEIPDNSGRRWKIMSDASIEPETDTR